MAYLKRGHSGHGGLPKTWTQWLRYTPNLPVALTRRQQLEEQRKTKLLVDRLCHLVWCGGMAPAARGSCCSRVLLLEGPAAGGSCCWRVLLFGGSKEVQGRWVLLFAEKQTLHEPPKAKENEGEKQGEEEGERERYAALVDARLGWSYSLALFGLLGLLGLLEGVSGANTAVLTHSTCECTC
jgi:hypothetical protein